MSDNNVPARKWALTKKFFRSEKNHTKRWKLMKGNFQINKSRKEIFVAFHCLIYLFRKLSKNYAKAFHNERCIFNVKEKNMNIKWRLLLNLWSLLHSSASFELRNIVLWIFNNCKIIHKLSRVLTFIIISFSVRNLLFSHCSLFNCGINRIA